MFIIINENERLIKGNWHSGGASSVQALQWNCGNSIW
jgi:hypothetical protein